MSEWKAKRFWKEVSVAGSEAGWQVLLDGRPMRTPAKAALDLPTEGLAQAVAEEWRAQEGEIRPEQMSHTRLANSAIDKVRPQRPAVVEIVAAYGASDLLCYRADGPEPLVARQAEAWDPMLAFAAERLGAPLTTTTGVIPVAQPEPSLAALVRSVEAHDDFTLAALHELVSLSGSLVLGLATSMGFEPAANLWARSRIDETYQEETWGHDDEAAEVAERRQAAFLFASGFLELAQIKGKGADRK